MGRGPSVHPVAYTVTAPLSLPFPFIAPLPVLILSCCRWLKPSQLVTASPCETLPSHESVCFRNLIVGGQIFSYGANDVDPSLSGCARATGTRGPPALHVRQVL